MIRARIAAAVSGALRGPWTHFTSLFEDLLDRLPRRHDASEQLVRLLTWFKELQERVEAAYLKATEVAEPVENTLETKEHVSKKTQEMNPRESGKSENAKAGRAPTGQISLTRRSGLSSSPASK